MGNNFQHTCPKCGKLYTITSWIALPNLGSAKYPWGEVLEYRNCSCGTTMAHQMEEGAPPSRAVMESQPDSRP